MLAVFLAVVGTASAVPLFDQLSKVKFINAGEVKASDEYVWGLTTTGRDPGSTAANKKAGSVLYLEKQNISDGGWGQGGQGGQGVPYLWKLAGTDDQSTDVGNCQVGSIMAGFDMKGGDIALISTDTPSECGAAACAHPGCGGFTWISRKEDPGCMSTGTKAGCCFLKPLHLPKVTKSQWKTIASGVVTGGIPAPTCATANATRHMDTTGGGATSGAGPADSWEACRAKCCADSTCGTYTYVNGSKAPNYKWCYLRNRQSTLAPSTDCAASNPTYDCYSGERPGRPPPAPPPAPPPPPVVDPPSGMRSAIPLGGISCGAVELRGDGSLHEWTIMNQSPGGSGKVQSYPDAYFAAKVGGGSAVALQTHPTTPGLKGVSALTYSGSYPVSKLSTVAADLGGLQADLYAFSTYKVNDMEASARPMAAFTLAASTTAAAAEDVTFMMNLPTAIEPDMIRRGTPLASADQPAAGTTNTSAACLAACNANAACMSWNFVGASQTCTLQKDAPNVFYSLGNDCGLRGSWSYDKLSRCLTLNRPGTGGSNGNMSICASSSVVGATASFGTYDAASGAFADLSTPSSLLNGATAGANGAVAVSANVPAASNATLTITFGWYFPERDHYGKVFGNYYKNLFASSSDAAFGTVAPVYRDAALANVVSDVLAMQAPFHGSSLEPWLQDHLVNSLSHIRTAMWFDNCPNCHKTADARSKGYWRQWEAFDCPDLDSIHNDGERHIPYIMFWPNSTRNKLAAWAGNQGEDGMLAEQIHNANPDQPEGRIMSDSTSMFICYILELLKWSGDTETLRLYYPTVKRAAEWQMNVSATYGVPLKLQTTYDILGFTRYELSSYSSVFHIMAMKAAAELATAAGDGTSAATFSAAAARGTASLDQLQWVNQTQWEENTTMYCPDNYAYVGAGHSPQTCKAACVGMCNGIFMSTVDDRGDCYTCPNDAAWAYSPDYTLYTKQGGAVAGSWAAASDGCTDKQGCATQHGFFADVLYAQVLAYSAGLGLLVSSEEKLKSHLAAELATNCVHADGEDLARGCDDAGIVILTGRATPGVTDWQIWEGGAPNHATVAIRSGESPATALSNFKKSATSWSERINDQWNTAGIKDTDGYPTVTSHYGFHMVSWHIPLAMSGQLADLSSQSNRSVTFAPTLPPPFSLPLLLPGVLGTVAGSYDGSKCSYTIALTIGELTLDTLAVHGVEASGGPFYLSGGGTPVVITDSDASCHMSHSDEPE